MTRTVRYAAFVRMYEIQGHYVRSGPREKSSRLDKLCTDLKECEIIHQPKNDENFTSLINAGFK